MKRLIIAVLVCCLSAGVWGIGIEYTFDEYSPDPMGVVQIEPTEAIVDIFTDNDFTDDDVDAKYLKLVRDYDYVPQGVKDDITEIIKEDPDDVLDKIKNELKAHLVPGKVDFVYMLIGNRMFSAKVDKR